LALEAENAFTLLPPGEQEYTRHQIAKNIRKLLNQQAQHNRQNSKKGIDELRILRQIKTKLHENGALTTKADKGNSVVVVYRDEYEQKVKNFISNNETTETNGNITAKFQKDIRTTLNECKQKIDTDSKWRYTNLNPDNPLLKGLIKVHKENTPIRPIVNFRNAPTYSLAKMFTNVLKKYITLPIRLQCSEFSTADERLNKHSLRSGLEISVARHLQHVHKHTHK
jgi:hypothetical protein